MRKKILALLLLSVLILAVVGCSQAGTISGNSSVVSDTSQPNDSGIPKTETTQQSKSGWQIVKVGDLLRNSDSYKGQMVVLEGKVIDMCISDGCWFTLNDGTGTLHVDLKPNKLSMPSRKRDASVKVYGEVIKKGIEPYLIGMNLEF